MVSIIFRPNSCLTYSIVVDDKRQKLTLALLLFNSAKQTHDHKHTAQIRRTRRHSQEKLFNHFTSNFQMTFELSIDVWVGKIVPFLDRSDWNSFSLINREFNNVMRSAHESLPPWPKHMKVTMTKPVRRIGLSANQEWFACGSEDGSIAIYHCLTGHRFTATPHSSPVEFLWFSPFDSHVLVSADETNEILIWDLRKDPPYHKRLATRGGPIPNHFRNGVVQFMEDGNLFVVHRWETSDDRRALAYSIWSTKEFGRCLRHWNERFIHGNVAICTNGNNRWKVTSYNRQSGRLLIRSVEAWENDDSYRSSSLGTWTPPPPSKEITLKKAVNMTCVYPTRSGTEFVGIPKLGERVHSWSQGGSRRTTKELDIPESWETKKHFFTAQQFGDPSFIGVYAKDGNTAALFSIDGTFVGTVTCDPFNIRHRGYMLMVPKQTMVWLTDSSVVHFRGIDTRASFSEEE